MGLRIPPHYQDAESTYAIKRRWVDHKKFDRDAYFEAIDDFKVHLARVHPGSGEVGHRSIVGMIAMMIDEEQSLEQYIVASRGPQMQNDDDWTRLSTAAAWYVLQRYEREVERGDWP